MLQWVHNVNKFILGRTTSIQKYMPPHFCDSHFTIEMQMNVYYQFALT